MDAHSANCPHVWAYTRTNRIIAAVGTIKGLNESDISDASRSLIAGTIASPIYFKVVKCGMLSITGIFEFDNSKYAGDEIFLIVAKVLLLTRVLGSFQY